MIDALSSTVDLALFLVTLFVVGKRPTATKVVVIICTIAVIDYGFVSYVSLQAHISPIEWYQNMLDQALNMYGFEEQYQANAKELAASFVAGISPAIYVVQASAYVFVGLGIRWVVNCVRKKSDWSPISKIDLSIWWLIPVLLGLVCFIASLFSPKQASHIVWLVSMNIFVVSVIPLFVQGAATVKGIMNSTGFSSPVQLILGLLGLVSGVWFFVLPVIGLIDFWANFRKLPREDYNTGANDAK